MLPVDSIALHHTFSDDVHTILNGNLLLNGKKHTFSIIRANTKSKKNYGAHTLEKFGSMDLHTLVNSKNFYSVTKSILVSQLKPKHSASVISAAAEGAPLISQIAELNGFPDGLMDKIAEAHSHFQQIEQFSDNVDSYILQKDDHNHPLHNLNQALEEYFRLKDLVKEHKLDVKDEFSEALERFEYNFTVFSNVALNRTYDLISHHVELLNTRFFQSEDLFSQGDAESHEVAQRLINSINLEIKELSKLNHQKHKFHTSVEEHTFVLNNVIIAKVQLERKREYLEKCLTWTCDQRFMTRLNGFLERAYSTLGGIHLNVEALKIEHALHKKTKNELMLGIMKELQNLEGLSQELGSMKQENIHGAENNVTFTADRIKTNTVQLHTYFLKLQDMALELTTLLEKLNKKTFFYF